MTARPKISLVIPTRERSDTLVHTLRSAVIQQSDRYEIVVSDNFSQDQTQEVVSSIGDSRVRYVNTGRRLSMSDNWEFALEHVAGEYCIFIGDDDAVLPHAIDRLEEIVEEKGRLTYTWETPIFTWPIDGKDPEVTRLPRTRKNRMFKIEPTARFVMAFGGWLAWRLPGIYHACTSMEILTKIKARTGRVFHTTQPDLFVSLAIPALVNDAYFLGSPVTVHGRSAKAASGAAFSSEGSKFANRYVEEFGAYKLHHSLYPGMPRRANFIADVFLVARGTFPDYYSSFRFSYEAMWAFLCRIGGPSGATVKDLVQMRRQLRRHHPFNLGKFFLYYSIQMLAVARRWILIRARGKKPVMNRAQMNVAEFASAYSEWVETS